MTRVRVAGAIAALAVTLAGCGGSDDDRARDSGREAGRAVRHLADARSAADAQSAAGDLRAAVGGLDEEVFDHVRAQVGERDDDIVGVVRAAMDPARFESARADLRRGARDVRARAGGLAQGDDPRTNEFWRGFAEGYDSG